MDHAGSVRSDRNRGVAMRLFERMGDVCMRIVEWAPYAMFLVLILSFFIIIVGGVYAMAGITATLPIFVISIVMGIAFARAWQLDHRESEESAGETDGSGI